MARLLLFFLIVGSAMTSQGQRSRLPFIFPNETQPLVSQVSRLVEALDFLGSSLHDDDRLQLKGLIQQPYSKHQVKAIQEILDPYCLAMVQINPEARVKCSQGPAAPILIQNGWKTFLVKVHNEAGVTARLEPESDNAQPILHISTFQPDARKENYLSAGQVQNRFLELAMYHNRPLMENLSGQPLEYAILQIYSRDAGAREAELGFNVGQGSQDIGFRNSFHVLFDIKKPVKIIFDVNDDDGKSSMASFTITDGVERVVPDTPDRDDGTDYRLKTAANEFMSFPKHLRGIYPLPSRRLASIDEYPDFFFQPQIYRTKGEHVYLPPGKYTVSFTRGPEYLVQDTELIVPPNIDEMSVQFKLKRWINLAKEGWFSADHHVHAAGCSHYESPEQGVLPKDMWRQQMGEDLNVAAVLTWGPGWYHQKQFFTGHSSEMSTAANVMRYDVEVSGFPSSHAGHIVLLNLREDDYPGTRSIEDWPSWTLPVLRWARSQGGITGYAHSGWGLQPQTNTTLLPNYVIPKMDGIGANEYVVTVTEGAVDFYSAGDTPYGWEMNMWYHTLNSGFKTKLSGETDFPCIFDERVGLARSYFKPAGKMNFSSYINAISKGRSYVSEGKSHIIDFAVDDAEPGINNSELKLASSRVVNVRARVAALLPEVQDDYGKEIAARREDQQPFWHIERARLGNSRRVMVELLFNGEIVDTASIIADGKWNDLKFATEVTRSCWMALRIKYSSHTNPVFISLNGKHIAEKKSAEWCASAVEQCWKMKKGAIRESERNEAGKAYKRALGIYRKIAGQ